MSLNSNYFFNQLWGKTVAKFENGEFCSFALEDGEDKCYFQYIKRDIADELPFIEKNRYFDIITPFDYGGFYYSTQEVLKKGLSEFELKCKRENIISAFFRFNPLLNQNFDILKNYIDIIKIQDHIIINLETDYEKSFSSGKRRDINRAKRYDYTFIKNDSIENFYTTYLESMCRIGANDYFKFDKEVLSELLKFGKIFSIKFDEKTVNSIFIIEDELNIYYLLGSGMTEYLKYGFNSLLLYLICDYYSDCKKIFFLGGGKGGLYQYKKRFSKSRVPFYIGQKIFDKEIYDKLIIQTDRQKNKFFPQYRKKII